MEKYEYYQKCLDVLKDLIDEYNKITEKYSRNYSAVFYYLFLDENKSYVNEYLVEILENIYEIAKIHETIIIVWKKLKSDCKNNIIKCDDFSMSRKDFLSNLNHLKELIENEIKRHNEEIVNKYKNDFINDLIDACAYLQRNKDYLNSNENSRNDYLRDLMEFKGYLVKDQSRTGISEKGKEAGETDLIIHYTSLNKNNIIIECMNLNKSNNKSIIENHYDKLMTKYDTNGNPYNVLISYVKSDDFVNFSLNYIKIIENYDFEFKATSVKGDREFQNENKEISILKSEHSRNSNNVCIYHILIHIIDLKE